MNILMIDELPFYIHGMKVALGKMMPDCQIIDANNLEEAIPILDQTPVTLILLDGELVSAEFIQRLAQYYPQIPVVVMLRKMGGNPVAYDLRHNIKGIITKEQSAEKISLILKMVMAGIVCFPDHSVVDFSEKNAQKTPSLLSQRQQEVLSLLANGGTNKQIGRQLNISAGTVKVHLESIFSRLQVHNRTQAARLWLKYMDSH
ncbi:LuxR C-terminal-related transcriptional regulator [Scandinavium goeteborgense]|jgi:DNA-binding NarL/FixJ family response regulator|uniref:LuxR C-terminal-related transcriptional regulator n=1 Tax=Scandinavium goeteborgense TaxID=1851514 RepID=UPI0037F7FB7C